MVLAISLATTASDARAELPVHLVAALIVSAGRITYAESLDDDVLTRGGGLGVGAWVTRRDAVGARGDFTAGRTSNQTVMLAWRRLMGPVYVELGPGWASSKGDEFFEGFGHTRSGLAFQAHVGLDGPLTVAVAATTPNIIDTGDSSSNPIYSTSMRVYERTLSLGVQLDRRPGRRPRRAT